MIDRILRNLRNLYMVLDGIRRGKLISEIYAEAQSSTVYKILSILEEDGYVVCRESRRGKTRYRECYLTDRGGRLLEYIEKIIELDRAH